MRSLQYCIINSQSSRQNHLFLKALILPILEEKKTDKNKILEVRLSINREFSNGNNSYGCDSRTETQELHYWPVFTGARFITTYLHSDFHNSITGPLGFLTLRFHTEPPAFHQLQFWFAYPWPWFPRSFCSSKHDSLYSPVCLYSLGGTNLSCVLPSLRDLKRVIDFSICSPFYLLLRTEWQLTTSFHMKLETRSEECSFE